MVTGLEMADFQCTEMVNFQCTGRFLILHGLEMLKKKFTLLWWGVYEIIYVVVNLLACC